MKTLTSLALVATMAFSTSIGASAQEAVSGKKGAAAPAAASTQAGEPTASAGKKAGGSRISVSKITRGTVFNLYTLKRVNADEAGALANKGALALLVGSRVVYVLKADGSSAGDDLARLASGTVGVAGKTMTRSGATVILADVIETVK
ncbi:MAG: hypothetical protein EAZ92_04855 [Candidatus Kapaibacterium sp.]|nr:MAG: hypothetical protein EAZ92_04855 [Candidatus Kapabacteria bacterium]